MNNTDPQRDICINKLMEMQNNPLIKCDIVSVAMWLSTTKLIAHTDAYIDYLKRAA